MAQSGHLQGTTSSLKLHLGHSYDDLCVRDSTPLFFYCFGLARRHIHENAEYQWTLLYTLCSCHLVVLDRVCFS